MDTIPIRFEDGSDYEQYMGKWSRRVSEDFLAWLGPAAGLHWLDIGCGNGAFTESVLDHCAPALVDAIDPSEAQLAYARPRLTGRPAVVRQGDAMALPFADAVMDVAVMPLVIFFVPDPAAGVAEMVRVLRPGGTAAAYAWDLEGGGFPYAVVQDEMRAVGLPVPTPPSPHAAGLTAMRDLWIGAGLERVDTKVLTTQRTFSGFDDYWATVRKGPSVGGQLRALSAGDESALQSRVRARLPVEADGRITIDARAHAVKGRVPPGRAKAE